MTNDYDGYDRVCVARGQAKTACNDCEYNWKCQHQLEYAVSSCPWCPHRRNYEKED